MFEIESPRAALRPWPTCSGPVGLAETNSTMTLPLVFGAQPNRSFCARISGTTAWKAPGARKKLMKPGPAISALATRADAGSALTIASATARGGLPSGLASASATLVAKSPNLVSLVASIVIVAGAPTPVPDSTGSSAARTSACRWSFMGARSLEQVHGVDIHRPAHLARARQLVEGRHGT